MLKINLINLVIWLFIGFINIERMWINDLSWRENDVSLNVLNEKMKFGNGVTVLMRKEYILLFFIYTL